MIHDKLANFSRYRGISKNIDTAIDFLAKTDLKALPLGKTEIDGTNVYSNRFEYTTEESGLFEDHRNYIDVHIVLDGIEALKVADVATLTEETPYSVEKDIRMLKDTSAAKLKIDAGEFALVFPREAHIPKLAWDKPMAVNKFVVKIFWEE